MGSLWSADNRGKVTTELKELRLNGMASAWMDYR